MSNSTAWTTPNSPTSCARRGRPSFRRRSADRCWTSREASSLAFADAFAGLGQELGHLHPDLALGDRHTGALEVFEDLAQHVVVARLLEIRLHNRLGVFGDVLIR